MKYILNLRTITLAVVSGLIMSSCDSGSSSKETTSTSSDSANGGVTSGGTPATSDTGSGSGTTTATNNDGQFLVAGATTDMVEIKSSQEAKTKGSSKAVKDIAQMMIDEHTKMSALTKDLASKKAVTLPADIPEDKKAMLSKVSALTGTDFDKEYIGQLVAGHNEAVSMLERASAEATDPEIKAWAAAALPKVRHHLQMITDAQSKIK